MDPSPADPRRAQPGTGVSWPGRAGTVLSGLLIGLLLAHSFAIAMLEHNHNEQMFVAAGALLSQGKLLYADFAFLQMPLLAHVYSGLFRVAGTQEMLLTAKAFTWSLWLLSAGVIFGTSLLITRDRRWSSVSVALFLSNAYLLRTLHEASAYVLPACASLASLACALWALRKPNGWLFAASGLLAGVATGAKAYHLVAALPVLAACALASPGLAAGRRRPRRLLLFAAGFAVASLPALFYAFRDFDVFWFNNFEFHRMTTTKYASIGYDRAMDLAGKLVWIADTQRPVSAVGLAVLLVAAGAGAAWGRDNFRTVDLGLARVAIFVLAATALATAVEMLAMTPMWPQYLALPVPYAILLVGALRAGGNARAKRVLLAMAWAAIVATLNPAGLVRDFSLAADSRNWASSRLAAGAGSIRREISARGLSGRVATLQPLWALEAGLPIYEELATGPFLFALGDRLDPKRRVRVVAAAPSALDELFAADPPAAILAGIYSEKGFWEEAALSEWARRHGYSAVRISSFRHPATLYLAP